ncbi:hypothetical protein I0C86_00450 [Plantactinospora sp. S1510]|uniref:Uncharacterized protein n=1 Tax=Plantactinospora alkalitolerans TaxID=2789879 RepID=A0ABS0GMR1_9ACTN|nr:hypothetical protein [Plantactinospora alkalitolerans]MBF9127472.1 hypothetical protein [Plantactinospora alkalitolerans]
MTVKSDVVEFARTLIKGDFEANDRYEQKLDAEGWDDWPSFLSALFFLAVERRFQGRYDKAEVIRFVAELRAGATEGAAPLDPANAELLIKAVFDQSVQLDIAPAAMGHIQTLVAYRILSQEKLSDEHLNDLLDEARQIVDEGPA